MAELHIQKIDSFDAPEIAPYRTMRRSAEHEAQGIFIAEGEKVVRRLLESHFTVVSIVLPEKWLAEYRPILEARPERVAVYLVEKPVLEELVGFSLFQGVLAVGKIPPPLSLDDILVKSPRPQLFVAVDELSNAENIGAIVRNCVALGASALIVGQTSSSPFLRRSVRNSMGTIFSLPVLELNASGELRVPQAAPRRRDAPPGDDLALTLKKLRARGVHCLAAHPRPDGKMLSQADFTGDCCIVLGSEGRGISAAVLAACDEAVVIPMQADVDSLNVGAAAAVFLYEVNRQRGKA